MVQYKWRHVTSGVVFMGGLFIMSLGIVCMIQAHIGVAPWDVLSLGLVKTLGGTVGLWSQLVGIVLLLLTGLFTKKIPGFGAFLNMFFIGYFVDLIMAWGWIEQPLVRWKSILLFGVGLVVSGLGTGMYIAVGWGAGPRDGFMLAMVMRLKWPFGRIRTIMEIAVLAIGWVLGGPVFIGTLIFCLTIGPICQYFIELWKRILDKATGRDVEHEDFNQRTLRINNHDGVGPTLR